jgi:hypothetical protein
MIARCFLGIEFLLVKSVNSVRKCTFKACVDHLGLRLYLIRGRVKGLLSSRGTCRVFHTKVRNHCLHA